MPETPSPTPLVPVRLFLPDDPQLREVSVQVAAERGWTTVGLSRVHSGAERPGPGDVVLVPAGQLPDGAMELAARLGVYAPARVVLLVPTPDLDLDLLGRASRVGAHDVVLLPVTPVELGARLDLVRRRPGTGGTAEGQVLDLTHQLMNVLAALRLTAYAVARLGTGGRPPAVTGPRPDLDGEALADRIAKEVDQAVALVAEVEHRVQGASADPDDGTGRRRWA